MKTIISLPKVIINSHCHGRDLQQAYKTTVLQVLKESLIGNISITCFMPNTSPPLIWNVVLSEYRKIIRTAKNRLRIMCPQYIWFGATDDNLDECDQVLKRKTVIGLKIYPKSRDGGTVTTGTIGVIYDATIENAMRLCKKHDKAAAYHCDDPGIISRQGYVIEAEVEYVKKIIRLMREVPEVKVVICHVSNRESAELIIQAQGEGLNIALELCPHYLWFDGEGNNWNKNLDPIFYHCYNTLRTSEHREYLVSLLKRDDVVIIISSDDAGHTAEEKISKGYGGLPGNQEMVAAIVTLAIKNGISEKRLARLLSFNAADFLNIPIERTLVKYSLVEKIDDLRYNNGKIINPWNGLKLLFPVQIK